MPKSAVKKICLKGLCKHACKWTLSCKFLRKQINVWRREWWQIKPVVNQATIVELKGNLWEQWIQIFFRYTPLCLGCGANKYWKLHHASGTEITVQIFYLLCSFGFQSLNFLISYSLMCLIFLKFTLPCSVYPIFSLQHEASTCMIINKTSI